MINTIKNNKRNYKEETKSDSILFRQVKRGKRVEVTPAGRWGGGRGEGEEEGRGEWGVRVRRKVGGKVKE